MRKSLRLMLIASAFLTLSAAAQAQCPPYRPCGPGRTWGGNGLIKQGFFGADFRPACQGHDTCELSDRECDRKFLRDMYTACESSARPGRCRAKARNYFIASRLFHMIPRPLRPRLPQ